MYGFKLWITGVRSNCCTNCATPLPIVLWFIILIKCKNYSKETGVCHFKTILAYSQHFFFICSICFFQPNHYAQLNLLSAACKQISKIQEFQFSDTIIFSAFFVADDNDDVVVFYSSLFSLSLTQPFSRAGPNSIKPLGSIIVTSK